MQKINLVRRLTETGVMLAVSTVLSIIPLVEMPFGGKLTPVSMLPVLLIAYRYGMRWGLLTGFVYGVIQMLLGLDNLSYATSALAVVAIILLDYLVAYVAMGFGGLFRNRINRQWLGFSLGVCVALTIRFLCHYITGITVWADFTQEMPVWQYSLLYNGAYMLPELVLTLIVGIVLMNLFDFRTPTLSPLRNKKTG